MQCDARHYADRGTRGQFCARENTTLPMLSVGTHTYRYPCRTTPQGQLLIASKRDGSLVTTLVRPRDALCPDLDAALALFVGKLQGRALC